METNVVFTYHTDAGHGWLAVLRSTLVTWGIADKISSFSYQKGNQVYLEEDCDMATFFDAADSHGIQIQLDERFTEDSPIRNYRQYVHAA